MSGAEPPLAGPPLPPGAKMPARDVADQLFLCESYPTAFLATPKCGSTFVKHLFWQIDNGAPHETADETGTRIHRHDRELPRGDRVSLDWVRACPYAFIPIRDPVERILSLYWDKLASERDPSWAWFRRLIAARAGFVAEPRTPAEHARNCLVMNEWIGENLRGETEVRLNNHWRPQQMRINMGRTIGLRALTVEGLEDQLWVLLGGLIPDLRARMAAVRARNVVPRGIPRAEMVDDALAASIQWLYWADAAAWRAAREGWAGVDLSRPDPDAVPRLDPAYL